MKKQHTLSLLLTVFCLWSANLLTAQQIDYYLGTENPTIDGSSTALSYEDQIIVLSYGFSVNTDGVRSQIDGVEFLIQGDIKAIPDLFLTLNSGGRIEKMTLTVVSTSTGGTPYTPVVLILENCTIIAMNQEGTQGDLPVFSIQVKPEIVTVETTTLLPNGDEDPPVSQSWDFENNIPL